MGSGKIILVGEDGATKAKLKQLKRSAVAPTTVKEKKHNTFWSELIYLDLLLLAGPIIRRAETQGVWLWIATQIPVKVTAWIGLPRKNSINIKVLGMKESVSFDLGRKLHITLAHVPPIYGAFPENAILAYNMYLEPKDKTMWAIEGEAALWSKEVSLLEYKVPTFVLPKTGNNAIRFLHGSCRKLHGRGGDAAPEAFSMLNMFATNPNRRPAYTLLTGDQIYADDVDDHHITTLALMGLVLTNLERIPGASKPPALLNNSGERGSEVSMQGKPPNLSKGGFTAGG